MNFISQSLNHKDGNCLAACVATLLNMPLAQVPNFVGFSTHNGWYENLRDWLQQYTHYTPIMLVVGEDDDPSEVMRWVTCIGLGLNHCDEHHAVILRSNALLFDPAPAVAVQGLNSIEAYILLINTREFK
jgi:hypothetical protein